MKSVNIDFINRIERNGGILDTRKYRYIIDTMTGECKRIKLVYLDTTAALDKNNWEIVNCQKYKQK